MRISDWSSDVCSSDLTREAARGELIDRWDRERQAEPSASRIILTHTNSEVRELNEAARGSMRAAGDLGDDVAIKVERGARDFASGDRIIFLRNRSEEHTSELQSLMRISYAVFCLNKKKPPFYQQYQQKKNSN